MSTRDFADDLHKTASTIGLQQIANLLTAYQKSTPKIEDDAIIKYLMYSPLVDLHDFSIAFNTPDIVKTPEDLHLGNMGYRKYIPSAVLAYDLVHSGMLGGTITFPKPDLKFGGRADFDGSAYVTVDDDTILKPTDKISIIGWFYMIKTGATQHIVKMQEASTPYNFRITNADVLRIRIRTDSGGGTTYNKDIASGSWTDNQWNHIVVTWSGTPDNRLRIYLNKVKQGSDVVTAGALQYAGIPGLGIGSGPAGGTNKVTNGTRMAWLSILHKELTASEVTDDFNGIRDVSGAAGDEILTIPFIDSLQEMPNAFAGMFKGG